MKNVLGVSQHFLSVDLERETGSQFRCLTGFVHNVVFFRPNLNALSSDNHLQIIADFSFTTLTEENGPCDRFVINNRD